MYWLSAPTLWESDVMQDKAWYIPVLAYHEIGTEQWYYNNPEQFSEHIKGFMKTGTKQFILSYVDCWKTVG